ncbi:MAG: hypothetical protein PHU41_08175, partial [Sulfuricurvum sp.]|nr:hypothetical protein [Sulfuricurvum sp.]
VDIPVEYINSLTVIAPSQLSGTVQIKVEAKTVDTDENGGTTNTQTSGSAYLNFVVDPVADPTTVSIAQASGNEDTDIALSIRPVSDDLSESFTVTINAIPNGSTLTYHGVVQTLISNGDGTTSYVSIAGFNSAYTLTIKPPQDSNIDFALQVSAHSNDGLSTAGIETTPLVLQVDVRGVADIPSIITSATGTAEAVSDGLGHKVLLTTAMLSAVTGEVVGDISEKLSIILTGLDSQFDIEGAAYVGGTGLSRKWVFSSADLGSINITTPVNYSGTIHLNAIPITTENDGNSLNGSAIILSIPVAPSTEATINLSTTVNEDTLGNINFAIVHQNEDNNETLDVVRILKPSVDGQDFTLYYGSDKTTLAQAVIAGDITEDGTHYILTGTTEINNIYVQNAADKYGTYSFTLNYTVSDVSDDHTTGTNTTTSDSTYALNIVAITDSITMALGIPVESDGDGLSEISVAGSTVTVSGRTIIDIPVTVSQVNNTSENGGVANGLDIDGSEKLVRFMIDGVPDGVEVIGATYIGDTGITSNTGRWMINGLNTAFASADVTQTIQFRVDGTEAQLNSIYNQAITITAYTQDNGASEQIATQSWVLTAAGTTFDNTGYIIGTPAIIDTFVQQPISVLEDTSITLNTLLNATLSGSSAFSVTLSNVPAGVVIAGSGISSTSVGSETFYTVSGTGDSASLATLLSGISVMAAPNSNTNNSLPLTFTATLTTYDTGGSQYTSTVYISQEITPVSDAITVNIATTNVLEDNSETFSISLSNPADGTFTTLIGGNLYVQVNDGAMSDGTLYNGETLLSAQTVSGVSGITDGNYYVFSGMTYPSTLNLTYVPHSNESGLVTVDAFVVSQEANAANIITGHGSSTFAVTPVTDGMTPSVTSSGNEDTKISLNITGGTVIDPSETIFGVILDAVPNGYLVYAGADAASAVLATNAGDNGSGKNAWSISLSSGVLPAFIGVLPPPNVSGTITGLVLSIVSGESAASAFTSTSTFDLHITPVADGITLAPTKTFGVEGDLISLNLNATVVDLDGSETVSLNVKGIGDHASFYENGIIHAATYNSGTDTYLVQGIAVDHIDNMAFVQTSESVTGVQVSAYTVETANTAPSAVSATSTFDLNITAATPTASDDQLVYKGNAINALAGIDTVIIMDGSTVNYANLTNIEKIDLIKSGDHILSGLTLDQVVTMTDSNHVLAIDGDVGDMISAVTQTGWTQTSQTVISGYTEYHYTRTTDSVAVTLKIDTDLANNTNLH